jgi:hypothetical protein
MSQIQYFYSCLSNFSKLVFTLFAGIHYYSYLIFRFSRLDVLYIQEKCWLIFFCETPTVSSIFTPILILFPGTAYSYQLWGSEMNRNFSQFLNIFLRQWSFVRFHKQSTILGYANLALTQVHRSSLSWCHFRGTTFHSISFPVDFLSHSVYQSISPSQDM